MGGDFAQGFFQAGLLLGIAVGLGLLDLGADGLALGGAAGEFRGLFGRHQGAARALHRVNRASGERRFMKAPFNR